MFLCCVAFPFVERLMEPAEPYQAFRPPLFFLPVPLAGPGRAASLGCVFPRRTEHVFTLIIIGDPQERSS